MAKNKITRAYEILDSYDGQNPYVRMIKRQYDRGGKVLNEFEVDYIINNHDFIPTEPNKTVNITNSLGEKLFEKYNLEFVPKKIRIEKIIGEMGDSIHAYIRYRQSAPSFLAFVGRKGILDDITQTVQEDVVYDLKPFEDKLAEQGLTLKQHQIVAIDKLLKQKKFVLADGMGCGKTLTCLVAGLASGVDKILVITTASVKATWKREAMRLLPENEINVVSGSNWKSGAKLTIINYDILQNFYTIAEVPVYEEQEIKDSEGRVVDRLKKPVFVKSSSGKLVQKTRKSRNKEEIKEALEKNPLFLEKFDCVIIDEVHLLSNSKTIRTKTVTDWLAKSKPTFLFLATGTPMTNKPLNLFNILRLIDADVCRDWRYYTEHFCGAREIKKRDGTTVRVYGEAQNLDELREKIRNCYIRRLSSEIGDMVGMTQEVIYYEMTADERKEYDLLWDDYLKAQEGEAVSFGTDYDDMWDEYEDNSDKEKYRQLIEGSLLRQYLAKIAVPHTIGFVEELLKEGKDEKIVVVTCFKKEMAELEKHFGNKCRTFYGGLTSKKRDEVLEAFRNDNTVQVLVGNLNCINVGLNLDCSHTLIFNSINYVASDLAQCAERVHRLSSTQDAEIFVSLFINSLSEDIWDKVLSKQLMSDTVIKSENQKQENK